MQRHNGVRRSLNVATSGKKDEKKTYNWRQDEVSASGTPVYKVHTFYRIIINYLSEEKTLVENLDPHSFDSRDFGLVIGTCLSRSCVFEI